MNGSAQVAVTGENSATAETEPVIVTGSNIPTAEEVGPNPVLAVNRDLIDFQTVNRPSSAEASGCLADRDLHSFARNHRVGKTFPT